MVLGWSTRGTLAQTITVGPGEYASIQAAVDSASNGDVIRVKTGIYAETITVNRNVTIVAYGNGPVTVDGSCNRPHGFSIEANNVTLNGIAVIDADESAVSIGDVSNTELKNLTLKDWNCSGLDAQYAAGVACWYCSGLTVTDSLIETTRLMGNGIWVKSTNSNPSSGGHYIARNTIIGGFDGIGSEAENDTWGGFVRDTIIEDNIIQNCHDDGIQVEGRDENVRVQNNTISGCGIGIAFAPNLVGPLYVEGNYIHDLLPGYYGNQECFKVGDGGSGTTYLTNNRCISTGNGVSQTDQGLSPIIASGNCLQVSGYIYQFTDQPLGSYDNDVMWTTDPTRFVKWWGDRLTLSQLQNQYGQEVNGVQVEGCLSEPPPTPSPTVPAPTMTPTATAQTPPPSATSTSTPGSGVGLRIEAGSLISYQDSQGRIWVSDSGFTGGTVVDRGAISIANTSDPRIYQTERFGMNAYSLPVANGSYRVLLHFAETYDGITAAGQRLFQVNVEGVSSGNVDVFSEAGGRNRALVRSVEVNVSDGTLNLSFTRINEEPLINGIEVIDQAEASPTATPTTAAATSTPSPTRTPTPSPTATPSPTRTLTPTPTFTATSTATPSPSPSPTSTGSPSTDAEISDDFESRDWNGGIGWLGPWTDSNSARAQLYSSSDAQSGSTQVRLRRDGAVTRSFSLAGQSKASLRYWVRASSFEAGDEAIVEISSNGSNWTTVASYGDGSDDNVYREYEVDLTPYSGQSQVYLRFAGHMSSTADYFFVDTVRISGEADAPTGPTGTPTRTSTPSPTPTRTPTPTSTSLVPTPTPTTSPGGSTVISEGFESGNWSGGTGWSEPWIVVQMAEVEQRGEPQSGNRHAVLRQAGSIKRSFSLANYNSATLTYWAKASSWEGDDRVVVEISLNGLTWTQLVSYSPDMADSVYRQYQVNLDSFAGSSLVHLRFLGEMTSHRDFFYLDSIAVSGQ